MKELTEEQKSELEEKLATTKDSHPIKFRNKWVLGKPLEENCPQCGHQLYEIIVEKASVLPDVSSSQLLHMVRNLFALSLGFIGYLFYSFDRQPLAPKRQRKKQIACRNCRKVIR